MKTLKFTIGKILGFLPDKLFLYILFYRAKGEVLNFNNPQRFTEKIQWLKVYGKLERYSQYVDKFRVRSYVAEKVGKEYLIPLLGVWYNYDAINFAELPDRFVLKVTHGCGYNYICKDKAKINHEKLRMTINKWMKEDFYKQERETQYRNSTPKIICEEYLEDQTGELRDYKFYCTEGIPKAIQVHIDRFTDHRSELLDINWKKLPYVSVGTFGEVKSILAEPLNLKIMLQLVRKLAEDFPFVRVDLYSVDNRIYFGELTFTPGSGLADLTPISGDIEFGKLINLDAYKLAD
jgi:hypothetical protein